MVFLVDVFPQERHVAKGVLRDQPVLSRAPGERRIGRLLHSLDKGTPMVVLHEHGRHRAVLPRHAVLNQRLEEDVLLLGVMEPVGIIPDEIDRLQVEPVIGVFPPSRLGGLLFQNRQHPDDQLVFMDECLGDVPFHGQFLLSPSTPITMVVSGISLPDWASACFTSTSRPRQHGTSMIATVMLLISFTRKMVASFST